MPDKNSLGLADRGPHDDKVYRAGTHRAAAPAETVERIRPHLRALGITRLANVTGLDRVGIPVALACRPNSRSVSVSQGKGLELEAARASALMEAVETWHAERITSPIRFGSVSELEKNLPLVDVTSLPQSQAGRYHPSLPMYWIEGVRLSDGASVWLPLEIVSTNYTLPLPQGSGAFAASTNGLASGNCLSEAISHGICEIVERDAATLWKLRGAKAQSCSALDLGSVDDDYCQSLIDQFNRARVSVKVWDITSDIGIAAFCALVYGGPDDWADPEFGAGCHPSRSVALARALTEAAQARVTFIAGSRDDLGARLYSPTARARRRRYCMELMERHLPSRRFNEVPSRDARTLSEDVDWELERLAASGFTEAAVVDLTRPELGIAVAKVVVPGLEGPFEHEQGDYVAGARARAAVDLPL